MKLYEILNNAKAAAENRSVDETWPELKREIDTSSSRMKEFLDTNYSALQSLQIWNRLVKQLMNPKPTALNRETKA